MLEDRMFRKKVHWQKEVILEGIVLEGVMRIEAREGFGGEGIWRKNRIRRKDARLEV